MSTPTGPPPVPAPTDQSSALAASDLSSRRPVLRPGLTLLRHTTSHWHLGHRLSTRVLLPAHDDVQALLGLLSDAEAPWQPPTSPRTRHALSRLEAADLVVPRPRTRHEVDLAGRYGGSWLLRAERRRTALVALRGPAAWVADLGARLDHDQVTWTAPTSPADPTNPGNPAARANQRSTMEVVIAPGAVSRELLDAIEQPHLVLEVFPDHAQIGPFVDPGQTACLRCVDAAKAHTDPAWPVVVAQQARAADRQATQMAPGDVDPRLIHDPIWSLAAALAVREIVAWVDGEWPATWSSVITAESEGLPTLRSWARHPECGCTWDLQLLA